jgi:hypothetical protein
MQCPKLNANRWADRINWVSAWRGAPIVKRINNPKDQVASEI